MLTQTENNAIAYESTLNKNLDFFTRGTLRGVDFEDISTLFKESWNENPKLLLQIMWNGRDCRKGKGEKQVIFYC